MMDPTPQPRDAAADAEVAAVAEMAHGIKLSVAEMARVDDVMERPEAYGLGSHVDTCLILQVVTGQHCRHDQVLWNSHVHGQYLN